MASFAAPVSAGVGSALKKRAAQKGQERRIQERQQAEQRREPSLAERIALRTGVAGPPLAGAGTGGDNGASGAARDGSGATPTIATSSGSPINQANDANRPVPDGVAALGATSGIPTADEAGSQDSSGSEGAAENGAKSEAGEKVASGGAESAADQDKPGGNKAARALGRQPGSAGHSLRKGGRSSHTKSPPGAPGAGGPGVSSPAPSALGALETSIDQDVAAYLDDHVSPERGTILGAANQQLIEAAVALRERTINDPDGSLLGELSGYDGLRKAFTKQSPGYEKEEPWLQTVARVRDVTSSLGQLVGTIGLVATVSGAILSWLVPPVGAFLLTVGKFCDLAAVILDVVSLACSGFLTGYNLYRLKNATDPAEKRRLLQLVRQDAMQTVMSTISVLTAVVPGAARKIGGTRFGKAVSNKATRLLKPIKGRLAGLKSATTSAFKKRLGRVGRLSKAVGVATKPLSKLRQWKHSMNKGFHGLMERARGTRAVQWTNKAAEKLETKLLGTKLFGEKSRFGKMYRENRELTQKLGFRSALMAEAWDRDRQLAKGERINKYLAKLNQREGKTLEYVAGKLEKKFDLNIYRGHDFSLRETQGKLYVTWNKAGNQPSPEIKQQISDLIRSRSGRSKQEVEAEISQLFGLRSKDPKALHLKNESGAFAFDRKAADPLLQKMREREYKLLQELKPAGEPVDYAEWARRVNADPRAKGLWNASQIETEMSMAETRVGTPSVHKTPHHTLPVQSAPHLMFDEKYIQLANDINPESYREFMQKAYDKEPNLRFVNNMKEMEEFLKESEKGGTLLHSYDIEDYTNARRNEAFVQQLAMSGDGVLRFPKSDGTMETVVFNQHRTLGHNWRTEDDDIARKVFGDFAEYAPALEKNPTRAQLQMLPGDSGEITDQAMERGRNQVARSMENLGGLDTPIDSGSGAQLPSSAAEEGLKEVGGAELPSTVPYSPAFLGQLRMHREALHAAMGEVQGYIQAAALARTDNENAENLAQSLHGRNDEGQQACTAQQDDITGQQDKLAKAGGSQAEMAQSGQQAKSESDKGKAEGDKVQSEGNAVTVEAKPETQESRGFFERLYDNTIGALWENLIKPAIDFVKAKIKTILEKISNFILKMINQALGLDEIEKELAAGGQDIGERKSSLEESSQGYSETSQKAAEGSVQASQAVAHAQQNQTDAQSVEVEAAQLYSQMQAQDQTLQEEETAGTQYIAEFGATYGPTLRMSTATSSSGGSVQPVAASGMPSVDTPV